MRNWRAISLGRDIATALAVFAMAIQVMLAPALLERHAFSVETDYGLTLLCGSSIDHAAADSTPDQPAPDHPLPEHNVHDCPCCVSAAGAAVLPQLSAMVVPEARPAIGGTAGWTRAQVRGAISLAGRRQPRAPPAVVLYA